MFKILSREDVTTESVQFKIDAPDIANVCKAGQFVIILGRETSERIPLTICSWNKNEGWITVVFQKVGASTFELAEFQQNDELFSVAGPLGIPTHTENAGYTVVIGGGLGIAIATPVAKGFKDAGNDVDVIIGARREDLLFLEDEISSFANNLYICTDDGSKGKKGFVTDQLKELIENGKKYDTCFVVGPPIMMKFVCKLTKEFGLKTIVSLNTIMLDGTGMCGACRVTIAGKTKFTCVDGPDFDGFEVDWDEMISRLNAYKDEEKEALERYHASKGLSEKNN